MCVVVVVVADVVGVVVAAVSNLVDFVVCLCAVLNLIKSDHCVSVVVVFAACNLFSFRLAISHAASPQGQ